MAAGMLVLVVGSLAAYLIIASILDLRLARRLEQIAHTERTRGVWAEAREALLELVAAGKLDVRSQTFRTFYGLQTFVMRRPDAYEDFSRLLAKAMLQSRKARVHGWMAEAESWPAEMRSVIDRMRKGTEMLVFGYASGRRIILRILVPLLIRIAPWAAVHIGRRTFARIKRQLKRSIALETERRFLAFQSRLEALQRSLATPAYAGATG